MKIEIKTLKEEVNRIKELSGGKILKKLIEGRTISDEMSDTTVFEHYNLLGFIEQVKVKCDDSNNSAYFDMAVKDMFKYDWDTIKGWKIEWRDDSAIYDPKYLTGLLNFCLEEIILEENFRDEVREINVAFYYKDGKIICNYNIGKLDFKYYNKYFI